MRSIILLKTNIKNKKWLQDHKDFVYAADSIMDGKPMFWFIGEIPRFLSFLDVYGCKFEYISGDNDFRDVSLHAFYDRIFPKSHSSYQPCSLTS